MICVCHHVILSRGQQCHSHEKLSSKVPKMDWDYDTVSESYARCLEFDDFFDAFYNTFLAKSPQIAKLFENTDFARQKRVVAESIPLMLCYASGKDFGQEVLAEIAVLHSRSRQNIHPKFYPLWTESLCETLRVYDPLWEERLERQWRLALQPGVGFLIDAY